MEESRQKTAEAREAVRAVAEIVRQAGGRALLVGGCVRDELRGGAATADFDVECFGIAPDRLKAALAERFDLDLVGASFGVIKLHHLDVDVSIPRRETKLGLGHRAFEMEYDPSLTVREASARRDFTVNAIYKDPLTGEIIDPWDGRGDLEHGVMRHVSEHFREDPLRVLRGMQFAARFGLAPAPETVDVCRSMEPEGLPPERLFGEWTKLLVKGVEISRGMNFLRDTGWVRHYPELERLIGCPQDPSWHPEGDVWNHTLCCLDAFAAMRNGSWLPSMQPDPQRPQDPQEDLVVGLAVLCHDFGKPECTAYDPVRKRIRSLGHDEAGVAPTLSFLKRLTNEERILKEVPPLVRLHMRPFMMWKSNATDSAIRRLAAQVVRIDRLVRVAAADDAGRPPFPREPDPLVWLSEQAERLRVADSAPKPLVRGRDLVALGLKPGVEFGRLLKAAYDAQLDGAFSTTGEGVAFVRGLLRLG
ncbi:MAG: polynucleotide adenylyltransferase [Kiritimatiellae bacterium]|nr:polynucleotide adenylyltransferase [Kiritimatiellia bacterium]